MTAPRRIVSLSPGSTEIVCALGLEDDLVGISHVCDFPSQITDRPRLTRPNIDIESEPSRIDQTAQPPLQTGASLYRIDTEQLQMLQPDIIITQDGYGTCAVAHAEVVATVHRVLGAQAEVLALHPNLLQDIWADIRSIGQATGKLGESDGLLEALFDRVNEIVAETIMVPQPPRVAVITSMEPLMVAGYWVPELIQLAGGNPGMRRPGEPAAAVTWPALQAYAPDIVVVAPCVRLPERTLADLSRLRPEMYWNELPAVHQERVYIVDDHTYLNRPGPRIVDSLELLAGFIQPDIFGEFLETHAMAYRQLTQ